MCKYFFFMILFFRIGFDLNAQDNTLFIDICKITEIKGALRIAVFNNEESYKSKKFAFITKEIPIKNKGNRSFEIIIPKGSYAIAVYQDLNNNKKLDLNILGIPVEPFGFSNNPSPLSIPEYKDVKFQFKGDQKISIKLNRLI